jgi:hypothetical protein
MSLQSDEGDVRRDLRSQRGTKRLERGASRIGTRLQRAQVATQAERRPDRGGGREGEEERKRERVCVVCKKTNV